MKKDNRRQRDRVLKLSDVDFKGVNIKITEWSFMNTSKTNEKLGSLSKEIYTQKLYKDEILK